MFLKTLKSGTRLDGNFFKNNVYLCSSCSLQNFEYILDKDMDFYLLNDLVFTDTV